jgi:putative cell wall-binding protein
MTALRRRTVTAAMALVVALLAVLVVDSPQATAAPTASQWNPGYIISDEQFYDSNSMSEAEIQSFLEARVPTCEPWRSAGAHDPIVCLKDFTMTTQNMVVDAFCPNAYVGAANERASRIIYKTALACGINPKVLLVTLEKEMSLVSHTWPSQWRYTKAMGYGCSDTAPCIEQYGGFQKQVFLAAKQFKRYKTNPGNYNYRAGQYNNIYYYPPNSKPECSYSEVYISNVATASLYNYTPYQPNAAALANLTGAGDPCSSYGNRNFWVLWWNWFGDPLTGIPEGLTLDRIGGTDRYAVAVGISQQYFPSGASTVYIATGDNFPDALSAAPAAAKVDAPLLLVPGKSIPASVAAELTRLAPTTIIVSGGPASVSDAVLTQLASYATTVRRETGADRYEVSRNVTRAAFGTSGSTIAYIATGVTFPDALSASAAAGSLGAPVILVYGPQSTLDPATAALLVELGVTDVRIAGGTASVSPGIEAGLQGVPGVTSVTRLGGNDRFQVSGATNRAVFSSATTVFVANGMNFPDALSGAAVAGANGAPLYVIPGNCIPSYVVNDIVAFGATQLKILGGTASITADVESFTRCR